MIVPSKPGQSPKKIPSSMPITLSDGDNIYTPTLTNMVPPAHGTPAAAPLLAPSNGGVPLFLKACSERRSDFQFFAERT